MTAQIPTTTMAANTSGQATTSGTAMRFIRSPMKLRSPRLWKLMCAKKPAIRKKVVIRKAWMANTITPSATLGWLSLTGQICSGAGTNENAAWNTIPSIRAKPLTASSACSRSGGRAAAMSLAISSSFDLIDGRKIQNKFKM